MSHAHSSNTAPIPGSAIVKQHLPQFTPFLETYFLTCLLHDIGTTKTNLEATRMSFEFHGGLLALNKLQEFGASKSQAESVAEAIIRHQDLGDSGTITSVGQLIQLATVFGKSISYYLCSTMTLISSFSANGMGRIRISVVTISK